MLTLEEIRELKFRTYEDQRKGLIEESVANDFLEKLEMMEAYFEAGNEEAPPAENAAPVQKSTYNLIPLRGCGKIRLGTNVNAVHAASGNGNANTFGNKTTNETIGPLHLIYDKSQTLVAIETNDQSVTLMGKSIIGKPVAMALKSFKDLTQSGTSYVSSARSIEVKTNGTNVTGVAIGVKGHFGGGSTATESAMVDVLADIDMINF